MGASVWDVNDRGHAVLGSDYDGYYRYDVATGERTLIFSSDEVGMRGIQLNERGDIAGDSGWRYEEHIEVVLADGSRPRIPGLPGLPFQTFDGLNDAGQILGQSFRAGPGVEWFSTPFLYTPGQGSVDVWAGVDLPEGWSSLVVTDLDDQGNLLGQGSFNGATQGFLLLAVAAPVPEPAAWALGLLGLVVLGARRRAGPVADSRP
jgi:hypothetical protein